VIGGLHSEAHARSGVSRTARGTKPRPAVRPSDEPQVLSRRMRHQAALGRVVRRRRLERGLSQFALARLVGTHRPLVARVESGKHEVNLSTLLRYAWALKCSASDVFSEVEALVRAEDPRAWCAEEAAPQAKQLPLPWLGVSALGVLDQPGAVT
jgi:transcriptional regulator with XRE-family HTH domain